jgi:predicted house-cleaning noncanonical NTP pyrophosphatase (MazG superfamily)
MSRPFIGNEQIKFADNTYENHLRSRMQECIEDYLQDGFGEEPSPRHLYEEMLLIIQELADYHDKHRERYLELKNYMIGSSSIPERY